MGATAAMSAIAVVQGVTAISGAYDQANAIKSNADFQKRLLETNAKLSDIQAADAIKRGNAEASKVRSAGKQIQGSQRAALAAQGLDIGDGSALDLQNETRQYSALDALTIKNNASREAWGYKVQGIESTFKGQFAGFAGENEARNTILTGGMKAIGYGSDALSRIYSQTRKP